MNELTKELINYQEWADAVFYKLWEKTPESHKDSELRKRWFHVTTMQNAALAVLKNEEPVELQPDAPIPELNTLKRRSRENHRGLNEFVSKLQPDRWERRIHVPWVPEPSFTMTVAELLTQIVMHTQHHRGQNVTRLIDLGGKPFFIEWIVWLQKGRPAARWD
jgi:uncharacterized damage-inducible protein DinB